MRIIEGIVAAAVLVTACTACKAVNYAAERKPNEHLNYYPKTAVVVNCDREYDTVTVRTSTGFLFDFYGADGWKVGDVVSMKMDNMDTESVLDDAIVEVRYEGNASDFVVGNWQYVG